MIGVMLGLLVAGAGYLGFKSITDVINQLKLDLQPSIDKTKKDLLELAAERNKVKDDFDRLKNNIATWQHLGKQVESIKNQADAKFAALTAQVDKQAAQVDKQNSVISQLTAKYQPLPSPTGRVPYRLKLSSVPGIAAQYANPTSEKLVFRITGNTGGVKNPAPQAAVAAAMESQFQVGNPAHKPAFLYLLGNIVYYNGEASEYYAQFYEPYESYDSAILAIPGNHDGSPVSFQSTSAPSLAAFMDNFCATEPARTPEAGNLTRTAMIQPNSYWTLETPQATIIGLYTNVPTGGVVDDTQKAWLIGELKAAPLDKALIITMHHSIYAGDPAGFYDGSPAMGALLDEAIETSHRHPDVVFSATSNNYMRFTRDQMGKQTPYIVIGTGDIGICVKCLVRQAEQS